jgi:hypothetical protein
MSLKVPTTKSFLAGIKHFLQGRIGTLILDVAAVAAVFYELWLIN